MSGRSGGLRKKGSAKPLPHGRGSVSCCNRCARLRAARLRKRSVTFFRSLLGRANQATLLFQSLDPMIQFHDLLGEPEFQLRETLPHFGAQGSYL